MPFGNCHSGPIRALLADDDPVGLSLLTSIVESLKIEPVTATTVASAKFLLGEVVPHIAILDVQLPDGDGIDILREIRRVGLTTTVAFISATLNAFPYYKCSFSQPDIIFSKPIDTIAIYAWVQKQAEYVQGHEERPRITRRFAS